MIDATQMDLLAQAATAVAAPVGEGIYLTVGQLLAGLGVLVSAIGGLFALLVQRYQAETAAYREVLPLAAALSRVLERCRACRDVRNRDSGGDA